VLEGKCYDYHRRHGQPVKGESAGVKAARKPTTIRRPRLQVFLRTKRGQYHKIASEAQRRKRLNAHGHSGGKEKTRKEPPGREREGLLEINHFQKH